MTRQDVAVVTKSAVLTLLLSLPVLLPAAVTARPDPVVDLGLVERAPVLEVGGASVTVAPAKDHYLAGEPITLVATVTNPTAKAVRVDARLQLVRIAYSSPMSRMRAMPTSTWEQPLVVDLEPGETRVVRLDTEVAMGNGDAAQIVASAGESRVIVASAAIGARPKDPFERPPSNVAPVRPDVAKVER